MEDLLLVPFLVAAWLGRKIYGFSKEDRSYRKINIFRAFFLACILFLLTKPILRLLDLRDFARSWHLPVALYYLVAAVAAISLVAFVVGEGHHDGQWNHRRGWWAIAAGLAIVVVFGGTMYLSRPF